MSSAIDYFAFGDSLTAGTGASGGKGFVPRYHSYLEECTRRSIRLGKSGTEGATSGELLDLLRYNKSIRAAVEQAKLITITSGGNDLMQAAIPFFMEGKFQHLTKALRRYVVNSRQMISTIQHLKAGQSNRYLILYLGLYNPLANIPIANIWIHKFNHYSRALARQGVIYVDAYSDFHQREAELLSSDHVHPNAEGYKVIADCMIREVDCSILRKYLT
jgi:lysophospholipase L1-like esterase